MNSNQHINHQNNSVQNGQCYTANGPKEGDGLYPSLECNRSTASYDSMQHLYALHQPPSYDEINRTGTHAGSRFGLIRGYHQQMYEPAPQPVQCCDCSGMQSTHDKQDPKCNWGIISGILLLILGVLALTMGFTLPQKTPSLEERKRLTEQELRDIERVELYVEVFIITGLTVLSLGGVVISAGILYPLCRNGRNSYDESYFNKYYASEVYVKRDDSVPPSSKQIVNFGFHKDVVPTDVTLRRIQPEREPKQNIDTQEAIK